MMIKKKVIGIYIGCFKTYTRYSLFADKKMVSGGDSL